MTDIPVILSIFIGVLLLLYVIGTPVAYALGLTSLLIMALPLGPGFNIETISQRLFGIQDSFTLLAVPLFILLGRMLNSSNITDKLFDFAQELVGHLSGGIGHVNIIVSILFSGMSGSAVADAAGLGAIEYRAMIDRGYAEKKGLAAGITCSSATIGPIIPPSIPLILYGALAQVSIGALFIAGIIPGILMGVSLMVTLYIMSDKSDLLHESPNFSRIISTFKQALPSLMIPIIIIFGIIFGIFTPTEAAAVAVLYALFLWAVYYGEITKEELLDDLEQTFIDTSSLLVIIAFALLYGHLFILLGITDDIFGMLISISSNPIIILLILAIFYILLGTFMEGVSIIVITVPIIGPMLPELGIDPVHFGIVMIVLLMVGSITPPYGILLFVMEQITDLELIQVIKGVLIFYVPLLFIAIVLIMFPSISLGLPRIFGLV